MNRKTRMAVLESLRDEAFTQVQNYKHAMADAKDLDPGARECLEKWEKSASEQWKLFSRLIALDREIEVLFASRVENKSEGNESKVGVFTNEAFSSVDFDN